MNEQNHRTRLTMMRVLLLAIISVMSACASNTATQDAAPGADNTAAANDTSATMASNTNAGSETAAATGSNDNATAAASSDAQPAADSAPTQTAAASGAAAEDLTKVAEIAAPPPIVESCKKEQFSKWEQQSRAAIKDGWESTKEQKYGIGFKTPEEYKQWSETHNLIFKSISEACDALSQCAKKNGKDKNKACGEQAATYQEWQGLAKEFTDKVEAVKVTQLDDMCGIPLTLDDSRNCFEAQSKNIAKKCQTEACDEASQCWQNLAFMNDAFIQAETACKFSHIKLDKCRGYIEQRMRRKDQIENCEFLQKKLNINFLPVL